MLFHIKRCCLFLIFTSLFFSAYNADTDYCVRGGGPWGFFAEFLWVLNHIEYCLNNNKIPAVYWGKECAYYSEQGYNGNTNCWEYYFEPLAHFSCPNIASLPLHKEQWYAQSPVFSTLCYYVQYLDNKQFLPLEEQMAFKAIGNHEQRYNSREFDNQRKMRYPISNYHVYSKAFRKYVKENLIDSFIIIKKSITEKINNFYLKKMQGKKVIGIHLRGNHLYKEVIPVPTNILFDEAAEIAKNNYPNEECLFFVATDQEPLLNEARCYFDDKLIFYECQRFNATTSPYLGSKKLHPKLGEDILIEMMLLSMCDHFVHTLSNVSTAALYFNPDLEHTVIY